MIYAARSLWEDPKLQQPTVILLVDREQLGDQMDRELNSTALTTCTSLRAGATWRQSSLATIAA